jgi:pimeloyl-ACP methyl ester carboxylesterase
VVSQVSADEKHTIEVDGRRLAWSALGAGPPLLLINGYAATGADWDPVLLSALQRSFTVICPDNRGLGGSDLGDPAALTIDAMADDMVALLDGAGIDRVTVAGWSMGGFVAQALTVRSPQRVAALVLLASDPGGPAAVTAPAEVWAALTDQSGTPRQQASRLIALLLPPALAPEVDRQFGDVVAAARAELSAESLLAQEAAIDAWHRQPPPPTPLHAPPVLACAGSEDVVIPPQNLEGLAARWRGAQTELFKGGGHAFMAQEPERVAALITRFRE